MSYTPTTGPLVVQTVQYVEEATPGTFPTNPTMLWVGQNAEFTPNYNMNQLITRNLGSEDAKAIVSGLQKYEFDLTYTPQSSTFLKYLINSQGGGSGSIDKYLSLLFATKINAVTNYATILGNKPVSGSIKWAQGKLTEVSMKLTALGAGSIWTTTNPIGTGSFASDPGTNPYSFASVGASGMTIGGTSYDIDSATVTINRTTKPYGRIGQATPAYVIPTIREIKFDATLILEETALATAMLNQTTEAVVLPLTSGTNLTLTNWVINSMSPPFKIKELVYVKYSGVAETAAQA